MAGWLHGVFVGEWLFVFPLCGFSLSLLCFYVETSIHTNHRIRKASTTSQPALHTVGHAPTTASSQSLLKLPSHFHHESILVAAGRICRMRGHVSPLMARHAATELECFSSLTAMKNTGHSENAARRRHRFPKSSGGVS